MINYPLETIATYSELYSCEVIEQDRIIGKIKTLNPYKMLYIGAFLLNHQKNYINMKKAYIDFLERIGLIKSAMYLSNVYLYSLQGVLYTTKWILANGDFNNSNIIPINEIDALDMHSFLTLQLMIADYLPKELSSQLCYMHKNLILNQKRNCKNDISRAFYIYSELARKVEDYNSNEYLDFNSEFEEKYNYSIETYLSVAFMLLDLHISDDPKYPEFELNNFIKNLSDVKTAKKIIVEMSSDIKTIINNAKLHYLDSWDFRLFNDNALLNLNDELYLSLSDKFIINRFFEGLYFNIRNIYEDTSFNTFIGRVFENYISNITEYAVQHSKLMYMHIPEFSLPNSVDNARSSDTYVKFDNKLLVVEAKGYRPFEETLRIDDENRLFEAVDKLLFKPIKQAINMYNRIINNDINQEIKNADEVIFLSITFEKVQRLPAIYDYCDNKLFDVFNQKFNYLNLNIEEYEYLCGLIEKGKDIFYLLNQYLNDTKMNAFINYLNCEYGSDYNSGMVDEIFKKSTERMLKLLFH